MTKAPSTVTADPQTKVQGSANPTLTATMSGYVLGQNPGDVRRHRYGGLHDHARRREPAPAPYPITCPLGTLTAANYWFGYVGGTLTVTPANTPPTISDIADLAINEDAATGAMAFTVGDAETAAGSLTVSGSSSNTALVPNANIVFGGSGANRTVTVTPAGEPVGFATITVTVTDAGR